MRWRGDVAPGWWGRAEAWNLAPAVELGGGAARIEVPRRQREAALGLQVATLVEQHVGKRVADFARGAQCASVVALRK